MRKTFTIFSNFKQSFGRLFDPHGHHGLMVQQENIVDWDKSFFPNKCKFVRILIRCSQIFLSTSEFTALSIAHLITLDFEMEFLSLGSITLNGTYLLYPTILDIPHHTIIELRLSEP